MAGVSSQSRDARRRSFGKGHSVVERRGLNPRGPTRPAIEWESGQKFLTFAFPLDTLKTSHREMDVAATRTFPS
jgi:hypothetical protein